MTDDAHPGPIRALVLGGGGLAGIAWEVGVLVGLAEGGVDLSLADRVVGTSAGSVVGTLLTTGVDLAAVHEQHLAGEASDSSGPPAVLDMEALGAQLAAAMDGARDAGVMRARLGAWALSADTPPESERRAIIDARLPVKEWPKTDLRISAVDAETGELAVFTRDARVELVDAVAASCAVPGVWPPMTAAKRRYIDGGVASIVHVARADDDGFEMPGRGRPRARRRPARPAGGRTVPLGDPGDRAAGRRATRTPTRSRSSPTRRRSRRSAPTSSTRRPCRPRRGPDGRRARRGPTRSPGAGRERTGRHRDDGAARRRLRRVRRPAARGQPASARRRGGAAGRPGARRSRRLERRRRPADQPPGALLRAARPDRAAPRASLGTRTTARGGAARAHRRHRAAPGGRAGRHPRRERARRDGDRRRATCRCRRWSSATSRTAPAR